MNTVPLKLEAALKAYLAANYQSSGMEFNGVTILTGKAAEIVEEESRLGIIAGAAGGPHARQGNFEVPVAFKVTTNFEKRDGESESTLRTRHAERCAAILGIFAESRVADVKTGLTTADAELGVSGFWWETTGEEDAETVFVTRVGYVFEAFIVAA